MTTASGGRRGVPVRREHDLDRLRSFSDSVFAVAITVLAVTFRLPEVGASGPSLGSDLAAEWPRYLSYLAGFVVIGFFWLSHHRLFDLLVRADSVVATLNLAFLFFVVLFPFSTIVLGEYRSMVPAHVLFNANAVVLGLVNLWLWVRTTRADRDVDAGLDPRALRIYRWRAAVFPVVFAIALAACSINERAAVASWALVFLGRPLIRLVLGPMPADETAREAAERDDPDEAPSSASDGRAAARRRRALGRLTGFSDNVYAFAITVLILPLASELPDKRLPSPAALVDFLRHDALPLVVPYTLGFVVMGLFWILHVGLFDFVRDQDGTLRILNLVHLLAIATLPFATSLLTTYDSSPTAIIVYAAVAGVSGGVLTAITVHATRHHRLIDASVPDATIRMRRVSSVIVPVSFLVSMLFARPSPLAAQALWYVGFVAIGVYQRRWDHAHAALVAR